MITESFSNNNQLLQQFLNFNPTHQLPDSPGRFLEGAAEKHLLSPQSPFLSYGKFRHFLVREGTDILARGTASFTLAGAEKGQGAIGFLEFRENETALKALLDAAVSWFAKQGIYNVTGPLNLNTYHRYRFVTRKGDQPAFPKEPWNPDYYPPLFEAWGFRPKRKYSTLIDRTLEKRMETFRADYQDYITRGYGFRRINLRPQSRDLKILYNLASQSFKNAPEYTDVPFEEFQMIYGTSPLISHLTETLFTLDPSGKEIGFAFALPDYSENFRAADRRKFPLGAYWSVLQKGLKKPLWIYKTLARVPGYHPLRFGQAVVYELYRRIRKRGGKEICPALIRENGYVLPMFPDVEILREYTLYEYRI